MNKDNRKDNNYLSSASKSRIGKGFIPHSVSPDNWPFWGERANPLSSKGGKTYSADYENYQRQNADEGMEDYGALPSKNPEKD